MNKYLSEILKIKANEFSCDVNDLLVENTIKFIDTNTVHFKMITFGYTTIIIGNPKILLQLKNKLDDFTSIELFDAPSLYIIDSVLHNNDLSLSEIHDFFIPSENISNQTYNTNNYKIKKILKDGIKNLENIYKYDNALCQDDYVSMNEMAYVAYINDDIASIAGTSSNTDQLWWVGVDTIKNHRRKGLASFLVNQVACDVIKIGKIPVYPTWYSNISSRLTAIKAGFIPGYVEIEGH